MQQFQVRVFHKFWSKPWSNWMVPEKWSPQWGFELNSQPFSYESTAFTTRPRLLAFFAKSFEFGKIKYLKLDRKKYSYNTMWSLIIYHWPEFTRPISLFYCFVCGSIIHCYNLVDVISLSMSLSDYIRRLLVNTFFV